MTVRPGAPAFPRIIVGAWQLSAGHHTQEPSLENALVKLEQIVELQAGSACVVFDCADIYTGVEKALGELRRRLLPRCADGTLPVLRVHTKLVPDRARLAQVDRRYVTEIVDRSLQRLGVDRLDLVQFAWWDYDVAGYVECGLLLDELRREGKIAEIGVTNFDSQRLREILDGGVPVVSQQLQYSALDHRPEAGMVELCRERGVAILSYGTLAGGFLSDRWLDTPDPAPDGLQSARTLPSRSMTKYRLMIEEYGGWGAYQALLMTLSEIAQSHDATVAQVAMAYALARPGVVSLIVGLASPDRWSEALMAQRISLGDAEIESIHALARSAPGPRGPVFGFEREPGGPHAAIMKYDLNVGSEDLG